MAEVPILSEKERQRAEFIGTTLAIIEGSAAEVHPLRTGGAVIVVGSFTWQRLLERAESFWNDQDPPDHPF